MSDLLAQGSVCYLTGTMASVYACGVTGAL